MNVHDGIEPENLAEFSGSFLRGLAQCSSIPDTSSAVVGNAFMAFRLHFLHGIVEEEIDQDGVEVRFRVLVLNLPPYKLDAPDAASTQLDLPRMTALNGFLLPDVRL